MSPMTIDSTRGANPSTVDGQLGAGSRGRRCGVAAARVLKFGGSSLATPQRIRGVARIVSDSLNGGPVVVVVSAFQGVTNDLLDCAGLAERQDQTLEHAYNTLAARHRSAMASLCSDPPDDRATGIIDEQLTELHDALRGIRLLGHCPPAMLDVVASFGERLSALIVAAYLNRFGGGARFVDARQFVTTDEQFTRANVISERTERATRHYFTSFWRECGRQIPVVTGFIGSTIDGRTTTIGRNGSDYTAALIGAAIGASAIEIWTDVDGVLSADPKAVSSAFVLPRITYDQAMEMSSFGAKVLCPATIAPAAGKSIPILIKNTFMPGAPGTTISRKSATGHRFAIGVSSLGDVTLLTLRGTNAVGVAGTARRLFQALASGGVNALMTSQALGERTTSFVVNRAEACAAGQIVTREFGLEFEQGLAALDQKPNQAIITLIGKGVKGRRYVASKLFAALDRHNIEISAVAHSASERSISCVVDAAQQSRSLKVIHQSVFETRKTLALAVVGVGNVGGAFLRQLSEQQPYLLDQGFDVKVIALADSKRFVMRPDGINLDGWRQELDASRRRMDPARFAYELAHVEPTNGALIDCTADAGIVDAYPEFINANLHIIAANKRANVLPWGRYAALMELLARRDKHFLYEANVGAGLPIISTMRNLIASGDVVTKVEGIFSGTLSYLFNAFEGDVPFSSLVRDAHWKGLTEPDPRDDLSGQDVARKLVILARQTGSKMEIQDVQVDSLVPGHLAGGSFSPGFFSVLAEHDVEIGERLAHARSRGAVLRYVGTLGNGVARAELREIARDHPLAGTRGRDNVIAFTTKRYADTPLVVQGPGAGGDVTAMGVFSDVLKLLHHLPG
ncbi:MAG: bifunctional aspartate kinase/homoserine dehydrogenase I [Acidobacteria bacterium]|nr:MAG: bifunctional aspartate kinase/homoserine dehydrogenase I [Acidobacteriota bacterium]